MRELRTPPSYETAGPPAWKMGVRLFGYTILSAVMSLFVYFSVVLLSTAMFQTTIGYYEYQVIDGEKVLVDTVYYDEDTDYTSQKETDVDGDSDIVREMITQPKDDVSAVMLKVMAVLEQLLMLLILLVFPVYYLYKAGDLDRNLVKHHHRTPTPLYGLQAGVIATLPYVLIYALLLLGKAGVCSNTVQAIYRMCNVCLLPTINTVMPAEVYPATAISVGQLLLLFLLLLFVPVASTLAYQAGYRRLFKKKKKCKKAA